MRYIVNGYLKNWEIEETADGFAVKVAGCRQNPERVYKTLARASATIRYAEAEAVKKYPTLNDSFINKDIWFSPGVLIVDDINGNYFLG